MTENPKSTITSKFTTQLEDFGITPSTVHRNLPVAKLVEIAVQKNEGILTATGSLSVKTGKYTGRSPDDRYIVFDDETHENVDWGKVNHQFPPGKFDKIFEKMNVFCYELHTSLTWSLSNALLSKYWKGWRYCIILWLIRYRQDESFR